MKKILKISGILTGLLVLLFAIMFFRFRVEFKKMAPLKTGKITDNVYAVLDSYVNFYLVKTGTGYLAFDGGHDKETILKAMAKLKIDPSQIKALFLTHSDNDHSKAVLIFNNAALYLSSAEEVMINGKTARFIFMHNKLERKPILLDDGQTVTVNGTRVKSILTPGHTPGSTCYLVNGRYLFTGDTLSLADGKVHPMNDLFNMDTERDKRSLKILAGLKGVSYIFTAHHGAADNFVEAFAGWK